jgi:hypothetical protein
MKIYKVIVLIPVWKRIGITEFCYLSLLESIKAAKAAGIEIMPLIIASEQEHVALADTYEFPVMQAPNDFVSNKLNAGLRMALPHQSDYITLLGSDNTLDARIWAFVREEMQAQTPFFGWSEVRFHNVDTSEVINAEYPCTTGVARFHRTDIMRKIAYRYRCEVLRSHITAERTYNEGQIVIVNKPSPMLHVLTSEIGIWTPGMQTGMDMDSERYINSCGYEIKHMRGQYITDYKSQENLTSWEEISNNLIHITYAED